MFEYSKVIKELVNQNNNGKLKILKRLKIYIILKFLKLTFMYFLKIQIFKFNKFYISFNKY